MSAPRSCGLCAEQRDILTVFGEELDPGMDQMIDHWHDHNHHGACFLAEPGSGWERRGPGTEDAMELAALVLSVREVICAKCRLVHRPEVECP